MTMVQNMVHTRHLSKLASHSIVLHIPRINCVSSHALSLYLLVHSVCSACIQLLGHSVFSVSGTQVFSVSGTQVFSVSGSQCSAAWALKYSASRALGVKRFGHSVFSVSGTQVFSVSGTRCSAFPYLILSRSLCTSCLGIACCLACSVMQVHCPSLNASAFYRAVNIRFELNFIGFRFSCEN